MKGGGFVKTIRNFFAIGYTIITCLFACCAVGLIVLATCELWHGIEPYSTVPLQGRFSALLESIGLFAHIGFQMEVTQICIVSH